MTGKARVPAARQRAEARREIELAAKRVRPAGGRSAIVQTNEMMRIDELRQRPPL